MRHVEAALTSTPEIMLLLVVFLSIFHGHLGCFLCSNQAISHGFILDHLILDLLVPIHRVALKLLLFSLPLEFCLFVVGRAGKVLS